MKKVIFNGEKETINVNELTNDSIIGFVEKYPGGSLKKLGVFSTEKGFYFSSTINKVYPNYFMSLMELIKYAKDSSDHSVYSIEFYAFDSSKALFKWLGE